jgi:hypothetical protein
MKNIKKNYPGKKCTVLLIAAVLLAAGMGSLAAEAPRSPQGADAVPDLYSPDLAGAGGFTVSTGGAPVSALNPAQAGDARRIAFDAG